MIPASELFDQSTMTALLEHGPLVQDYRTFFSFLDWSAVEQWQAQHSSRGRPAHPGVTILSGAKHTLSDEVAYEATSSLRHRSKQA